MVAGLIRRLRNTLAQIFFLIAALRRWGDTVLEAGHWTTRDWSGDEFTYAFGSGRVRYVSHGSGPALVLLHGMACCWQWWLECIPTLAQQHRVIAVDLPGFGDSDPLPAGASIADQADAVAALLGSLDLAEVALVGHSMGGLVATSISQRYPGLVRRLILVDAGGVPMSERRLAAVLKVLRVAHRTFTRSSVLRLLATSRRARSVMLRGAMADPGTMSDALAAVVIPKLNAPGFLGAIEASARAVRASRPESIGTPTSLIWGERDVFAPVSTAHDMLSRLPDGSLTVLAGVGHSPMVEAPADFCEVLLREASLAIRNASRSTT